MPYRFAGPEPGAVIEILLVTSFRSRRWIIPKGNIDDGMLPHHAAAKEAEEEGGVRGIIGEQAIGSYCYGKFLPARGICEVKVDVYPLRVSEELTSWPEMDLRDRQWLPIGEAVETVGETDLAAIMRSFAPDATK